jgi:hypothetical protein
VEVGTPALWPPVAHALRRPKAARWMRAACALRRGRATERWGGGCVDGRLVACGVVASDALRCFASLASVSSAPLVLSSGCPCPLSCQSAPSARPGPPGSSPPPASSLDSTPLHFHFHPPEPSKNPSVLPSSIYFQIRITTHSAADVRYGRPRRFYRPGRPIQRSNGRSGVDGGVSAVLGISTLVRAR